MDIRAFSLPNVYLDCLTTVMGLQAIAQIASFTGVSVAEDSFRVFFVCCYCLVCLFCLWLWICLGTRDGLSYKNMLQMTNGRSGLSLSKGSLLPPCSWLPCLCFLSPWLQTPTRFLHLLCFHMFDISLDLSPGILGLCLLLNPQKPSDSRALSPL